MLYLDLVVSLKLKFGKFYEDEFFESLTRKGLEKESGFIKLETHWANMDM